MNIISNGLYKFHAPSYDLPIPSLSVEFKRYEEMENVATHITAVLHKYNIRKTKKPGNVKKIVWQNVLSRTLFQHFSKNAISKDPLFPVDVNEHYMMDHLQSSFLDFPKKTKKNKRIRSSIKRDISLNSAFKSAIERMGGSCTPVTVVITKNKKYYDVKINSHTYTLLQSTCEKLERRYRQYQVANGIPLPFNDLLGCALLRYASLNSSGHQWAMPRPVKDEFYKLGVNFECFASCFNHQFEYYCSMFPDIERFFMSLGPFQHIKYIKGFYMANPPYEIDLLTNMTNTILTSVSDDVQFVFGLPLWGKFDEFKLPALVEASPYFKKKYKFDDKELIWYDYITGAYTRIPASLDYLLQKQSSKSVDDAFDFWKKFSKQH